MTTDAFGSLLAESRTAPKNDRRHPVTFAHQPRGFAIAPRSTEIRSERTWLNRSGRADLKSGGSTPPHTGNHPLLKGTKGRHPTSLVALWLPESLERLCAAANVAEGEVLVRSDRTCGTPPGGGR